MLKQVQHDGPEGCLLSDLFRENKMDNTKYIALSRQMGLWKQMDVVSNNMANMNTSGFKSSDVLFSSYIMNTKGGTEAGKLPVRFANDFATFNNFEEGTLIETGNTFDVSIQGDAFFAVETGAGERYTRKGQFHLDANGQLVNQNGQAIMSENNEPFFFAPGEKEIVISDEGTISTENGIIGRLKLVRFDDDKKLIKMGDTMFTNVADNGMHPVMNEAFVKQGVLEKSNVNSILEMTKMINLQRSYEHVQHMIDAEHDRISNVISTYAQLV